MDEKTELLICLGAATAANCIPCFDYLFKHATAVGLAPEEVEEAVRLACKVKTGAGVAMQKNIRKITGRDCEAERTSTEPAASPCGCA